MTTYHLLKEIAEKLTYRSGTGEIPDKTITVHHKSHMELSIYLVRKSTNDVVRFRVAATPCLTRFQFTPSADLVPPLRPLP
jgi:hypothetical protein